MFNFERLDILCAWIGHPTEKLLLFDFLASFHCSILSVSIYYLPESDIRVKSCGRLNFPCALMFNFERLDILWTWIKHSSEKLWPYEFAESFHCSISSVSIYYWPKSDIRAKSYGRLNLPCASMFLFRASRYIMLLNPTFDWKVITIWLSRELSLFNFERLDILLAGIGHPSQKLWPFEFALR